MPIKTYRGLIPDGDQIKINLRTNDGKVGYRINKFQVIPEDPAGTTGEITVKIFKEPQTTVTDKIRFDDLSLLGCAYYSGNANPNYPHDAVIIFDSEVFNQDIHITQKDTNDQAKVNYYLELEQVKLNDNETTMATLQSLRSRYESFTPAGPS